MIVDTREQSPWTFQGLEADKKHGGGVLCVRRRSLALETGDYSVEGAVGSVCVERKSGVDLLGTITTGRDRFAREHDRMAAMGAGNAIVVIEASLSDFFANRFDSRLDPKCVLRTAVSWMARYGVPWIFCEGRRMAEEVAYRYLEKWWEQHE